MVLTGNTLRITVSKVRHAPSGTRWMKFMMLYGLGPSNPPPIPTHVRFSGPV